MSTTAIRYIVKCSVYSGNSQTFTFSTSAPSDLCKPSASKDALGAFSANLVETYNQIVMDSHPWECVVCGQPATKIVHNPMSYLRINNPFVYDMAILVCVYGRSCEREIRKNVDVIAKEVLEPYGSKKDRMCRTCYKIEGVVLKACGKCKIAEYCSTECQKKDWRYHKMVCFAPET